jgi:hypothetical protein
MSRLTLGRAALIAAAVAVVVYANALGNGWAVDDVGVVRDNPAAHSIGAAWEARFSPYWPVVEGVSAGLWRPAIIMSYAVDWTLSGGREWWFHLQNVLLHALVTALVVFVVAPWLPPLAALAAGLVFAVHPVHVEAVANVVGRAEIQTALGILLAVLAFRRARTHPTGRGRALWFGLTTTAVLLALLSKEHGVVTVAILALDAWLLPGASGRSVLRQLSLLAVITVAWFVMWQGVAAGWVRPSTATALRYLSPGERVADVLPVYLEVLRLLTWPLTLAHDYNPQTIPQRTELTAVALLGLAAAAAVVALAVASLRRAPVVAFGIFVGLATYAPSSNLLFPAGTMLGERLLYLAALATACTAGWLVWRYGKRPFVPMLLGLLLLVYAVRTFTRTPFWRDSTDVVIAGSFQLPENFRVHMELGHLFLGAGDSTRALAEYLLAGELFGGDPFVAMWSVPLAMEMQRPRVALYEARRVYPLAPQHAAVVSVLAGAYRANDQLDSSLAVARRGVEQAPRSRTTALVYGEFLHQTGAPAWQLALAEARLYWRRGHLAAATGALLSADTLLAAAREKGDLCWEIRDMEPVMRALHPAVLETALRAAEGAGLACSEGSDAPLR